MLQHSSFTARDPRPRAWVGTLTLGALLLGFTSHPGNAQVITLGGSSSENTQDAKPPNRDSLYKATRDRDIITATRWDSAASGWTGRMVIGEYATGAFCGACQMHDQAFNGLLRRYPAPAFVSIAYHYLDNFPLSEPADSTWTKMLGWYDPGLYGKTSPKIQQAKGFDDWINGVSVAYKHNIFDFSDEAIQNLYTALVARVDAELKRPPEAFFLLSTAVDGGTVHTRVRIDSLKGTHPQLYLRLVVVEDTVRLYGDSTATFATHSHLPLRLTHHMVARAVAGTPTASWGIPITGPGTTEYTFDIAAIQARRLRYHQFGLPEIDKYYEGRSTYSDSENVAMDKEIVGLFSNVHDWKLDPKRLHVIAFIQDGQTGEVLQGAMLPIETSTGNKLQLP